jgi:hypothetical protein
MRAHVRKLSRKPFATSLLEGSSEVQVVAGERSQLLARKYHGKRLSTGERERLEFLTQRLKQLLPPISADDLEVLLEMTEEAERIRERALERRHRLG